MFKFEPCAAIRKLTTKQLMSKTLTVMCGHTDLDVASKEDKAEKKVPTKQYFDAGLKPVKGISPIRVAGWGPYLGKEGTEITVVMVDCCIKQKMNGGRSDYRSYKSYADYFNPRTRAMCEATYGGGLMYKLFSGGGDVDQAEVEVHLETKDREEFVLTSFYLLKAPGEWYSEYVLSRRPDLRHITALHDTAEEAMAAFEHNADDDLFGTRKFPVIVFPKKLGEHTVELSQWAKGCSGPIASETQVFAGLRCKMCEFDSIVREVYKRGGKVAKGIKWEGF